MSRSNIAEILLYGGGFIIVYAILKSWGIIATSSSTVINKQQSNWKPLTEQELNNLKVDTLEVNPYIDDKFETRTGRDRNHKYGFVGNTR